MRLRTFLAVLIGFAPALLEARNPTILIEDPPPPAIPVTSNTFAFGADASGGGVFAFQNASGNDWGSMLVTATLPNLTPITCGPGPFLTCTVSEKPVLDGYLYDILFGPAPGGGITAGTIFTVNLNDDGTDPNGSGSWPVGQDFDAKTTVVPEPGSVLLLMSGGLLVAGLCRRRASISAFTAQ